MSGPTPNPTELVLHQTSHTLEVAFESGERFRIPYELMRVYSPSAEVQGHSPQERVLQSGKRGVTVTALDAVGHYAVRAHFSDGHDSGIFTWAFLHQLGREQDAMWAEYLAQLASAGRSRDQ